jgi:hypothetical protein
MPVTLKCQLLAIKNVEIRKGENAGKSFAVGHFYDGENLYKISIPNEQLPKLKDYLGKPVSIEVNVNLDTKKLYFRSVA